MFKDFESLDELYPFFVSNLIKPKGKSKVTFLSGTQLDRSGWHLLISKSAITEYIQVWFSPYPYGHAKWVFHAQKYTDSSQDS